MERLLTRSRVLLAFCCTLLLAALNRRDPMVYGMFLFLATVTVMGFVLPWLSLRGMAVRLRADGLGGEVIEGAGCDIGIVVGSTNFDNRSFRLNDEANLNVYDAAFAQRQTQVFEDDIERSRRVTYQAWLDRPLREKAHEKLTALLRSQL